MSMPKQIAEMISSGDADLPLLRAKKILGDRLVWLGKPKNQTKTCWSLDGKTHATDEEIRAAAGMPIACMDTTRGTNLYRMSRGRPGKKI